MKTLTFDVYWCSVSGILHDSSEKHWYICDLTFLEDGLALEMD